MFGDLVGYVVYVAATFCRRYAVDEAHLFIANVTARDRYIPSWYRIVVENLNLVAHVGHSLIPDVQYTIILKFRYWQLFIV